MTKEQNLKIAMSWVRDLELIHCTDPNGKGFVYAKYWHQVNDLLVPRLTANCVSEETAVNKVLETIIRLAERECGVNE